MSFNVAQARYLARLLKIKNPTPLESMTIQSLIKDLGAYGESLYRIARERQYELVTGGNQ
jgi:hypothetical protein